MRIIEFFKRLFSRKKQKLIAEPKEERLKANKDKFLNSIKVEAQEKTKKNKIKTMICDGDGLGISNKMTY